MTTAETTHTLEGIIVPCEGNTLVKAEPARVTDIFTSEGVVDAIITFVGAEARAFTPDLSTATGRKAIASRAYRVAQTKTYLDDLGKEEVARMKELPKAIDAGRKRLRDALDALKDEIRKPLTEWEERAEAMKQRLADMQAIPDQLMVLATTDSERIKSAMESLETHPVDAETWGEFAEDAVAIKAAALAKLQTMLDARLKFEADQAELERLRKAEADRQAEEERERLRREGEERARRESEERERQAREDAERQAREAKEATEKAEREKKEAEERLERERAEAAEREERARQDAAAAERRRLEQEKADREAEEQRRAADEEHRRTFNREAMTDIQAAIPSIGMLASESAEAVAKAVLCAIAKGQVRHVAIHY